MFPIAVGSVHKRRRVEVTVVVIDELSNGAFPSNLLGHDWTISLMNETLQRVQRETETYGNGC